MLEAVCCSKGPVVFGYLVGPEETCWFSIYSSSEGIGCQRRQFLRWMAILAPMILTSMTEHAPRPVQL